MRLLAIAVIAGFLFAGCTGTSPEATAEPVTETPVAALPPLIRGQELSDDIAALMADLADGAVTLPAKKITFLGPGAPDEPTFDLEMVPSTMAAQTWVEVDGVAVNGSWFAVYEGHVAGDVDALARLVVAPDWASGYVRVGDVPYAIRIGMEGNFPAGVEVPFVDLIDKTLPFDPDGGRHPHDCLYVAPTHVAPVIEVDRSQMATITADIILDADAEFLRIFGHHSVPLMLAFLAEVDAIYDHEMGLRFNVMGVHLSTNDTKYPAPEDDAPLGAMADYWNTRHTDRDMVHLYTGHPSSYAQANCIGGAGIPELAYTFTTVQWASYEGSTALRHTQTYAHELGHILSAHHHYATVEGELQTIMAQGANKYAPVFSTVSKSIMRGWVEDHVA